MSEIEALLALLAVTTLLVAIARRIGVPYPILLVMGGLGLGFVPGLPHIELDPEHVFLLILPPILQSAAFFTPIRDFRAHLRPILSLAVALVLVTTVAVAVVAHWLVEGLSWPAAFVLGAIVSPPDAVAATSVAERLHLPRRVVTILEGESLVNDATALVTYRVAVAAATTGIFSLTDALEQFLVAAAGGVLIGLVVGWVVVQLLVRTDDSAILIAITLLAPYAAYLAAEELLHASGVLAVVVQGLLMGRGFFRLRDPGARLQSLGFWNMFIFLLNGFVFILIGVQLPLVMEGISDLPLATLLGYGAAVSLAAIVARMAWVFGTSLPGWRRNLGCTPRTNARELGVIGWAGMRGVVSLAAALALEDVPGRDLILFLTFGVILVTLVAQGLTLAPLIRWLGIAGDEAADQEELAARRATAAAARTRLDELAREWAADAEAIEDLALHLDHRVRRLDGRRNGDGHAHEERTEQITRLQHQLLDAEMAEAIRLRDAGRINDQTLRQIQREVDVERLSLRRL